MKLPVNQNDIIKGFRAGEIKPGDLPLESRCRKCPRPHLSYNRLCGPCEIIADKAYMEAPAAAPDAEWP